MAALTSVSQTKTTDSTSLATQTYDTVAASNFVAGGTYLIWYRVSLDRSNAGADPRTWLEWATTGEIAGTLIRRDTVSTVAPTRFQCFSVVTIPNPAEDLELTIFLDSAGGGTGTIYGSTVQAIRLDDQLTEGSDYYHQFTDSYSTPRTFPTKTGSDRSYEPMTETFAASDWLVLSKIIWYPSSSSVSTSVKRQTSGGGVTTYVTAIDYLEGEAGSVDRLCSVNAHTETLDGTSATLDIVAKGSVSGESGGIFFTEMFALDLALFEDYFSEWDDTTYTHTTSGYTSFEEVQTSTFTPTTAGEWFLMGGAFVDGSGFANRMQVDSVSVPAADVDIAKPQGTPDTRDQHTGYQFAIESLPASSTTVSVDVAVASTAYATTKRTAIGFSLELAGGGGPTATPKGVFGLPLHGPLTRVVY